MKSKAILMAYVDARDRGLRKNVPSAGEQRENDLMIQFSNPN